jgi:hypothetical protein
MPLGALHIVELPGQITSLPPEIKQAGCPFRVIWQVIKSQQKGASNSLILRILRDMYLMTITG